ncbi:hypothetical protein BN7_1143 [Wickerhamomyces ciferrii]|uniref:DRBM domain-containing protein n=1 Tax=Wickerhamomyces ciferrii (strain ATCC 14091 / BCRC 22168 / CBS 111 / JCM 3599 / NBRC 0793 / NRRL Y-1031 F-60-10) TaxID=1206466 RepID=K0KHE3_WICCF|nr:uncharacterized protein BN7_1143 [Wickerhamomyces ciferrii]CCH41602.1 hypothetical protein BN7_1143 [Wickerhamomyces ciferrii]
MLRCIIRKAPKSAQSIARRSILHGSFVIRRVNIGQRLHSTSAVAEIISNVDEIQLEVPNKESFEEFQDKERIDTQVIQPKRPQLPTLDGLSDYQISKIFNQIPSETLNENIETFAFLGESYLDNEIVEILYEAQPNIDQKTFYKIKDKIKNDLIHWTFPFDILENLKKNYERVNNYEIHEHSFKIDDSNKVLHAYFGVLYLAQKDHKDIKPFEFLKSLIEPIIPSVLKTTDQQDLNLGNHNNVITTNKPVEVDFTPSSNTESSKLELSKLLKTLWQRSLKKAETELISTSSIDALLNLMGGKKSLVVYETRKTANDGYLTDCIINGVVVANGQDTFKFISKEKAAFKAITLSNEKIYESIWLPMMYNRFKTGDYQILLITYLKNIANMPTMEKFGKNITEDDILTLVDELKEEDKKQIGIPDGKSETDHGVSSSNNISKLTSTKDKETFDSSRIEDRNLRKYFEFKRMNVTKFLSLNTSKSRLNDILKGSKINYETTRDGTKITSKCLINDILINVATGNTIEEAEKKAAMNALLEGKERIFHDIWFPMNKKKLKMSTTAFKLKYREFLKSINQRDEPSIPNSNSNISKESSNLTKTISTNNSSNINDLNFKLDDHSNLKKFFQYELNIARSGLNTTLIKQSLYNLVRGAAKDTSIKYRVTGANKENNVVKVECFVNNHLVGTGIDAKEKIAEKMAVIDALKKNEEKLFNDVWLPMAKSYLNAHNPGENVPSFIKQYLEFLNSSQNVVKNDKVSNQQNQSLIKSSDDKDSIKLRKFFESRLRVARSSTKTNPKEKLHVLTGPLNEKFKIEYKIVSRINGNIKVHCLINGEFSGMGCDKESKIAERKAAKDVISNRSEQFYNDRWLPVAKSLVKDLKNGKNKNLVKLVANMNIKSFYKKIINDIK